MSLNIFSKISRRNFLGAATLGACAGALSACASHNSRPANTVEYWLWDASQLPAYEACAQIFTKQTGINVNITQIAWNDYWTKLTASFIAGTGPDVFADHISKFAQFVDLEVLAPLNELSAWNNVDESAFQPGLLNLWKGQDGKQYGCPKDWDTEAFFYNKSMLAAAGLTEQDLYNWEWNPRDGGSFEKILARLTVDKNGVRADETGFDPAHIAVYGLGIAEAGDVAGQTQWSPFTGSVGDWTHTDKPTWGTHYRFNEKQLHDTLNWYFGLVDKGYLCPSGAFSTNSGTDTQMGSGSIAMCLHGSWMLNTFANLPVEIGIAPTPRGPNGTSTSMFNGLGDSIVKNTNNLHAAASWVTFLGSQQAQDIVASYGIVFPAISTSTQKALEVFAQTGLATTPFTQHLERGTTFYFPLTYFGADVTAIFTPGMDALWSERKPAVSLNDCNEQVNLLFRTSAKTKTAAA